MFDFSMKTGAQEQEESFPGHSKPVDKPFRVCNSKTIRMNHLLQFYSKNELRNHTWRAANHALHGGYPRFSQKSSV